MAKRSAPKRVKFSRKQRHALLQGTPEPEWDGVEDINSKMATAFNWYNYNKDPKDATKYLIKFCQGRPQYEKYVRSLRSAPDWKISSTAGWLARMADQGAPLEQKSYDFIEEKLNNVYNEYKDKIEEKKQDKPNLSVQQKIHNAAMEHVADIEVEIDNVFLSNFTETFDSYKFMADRDLKGKTAQIISKHFQKTLDEYQQGLNDRQKKINSDLAEAFEDVPISELKRIIKLYKGIVDSANTIAQNAAKARKPKKRRVRKGKTADKIVSKLKYMESFDDLKLVSENPEKIVGAKAVFFYNTKRKTLTMYMAEDASGLTVSRSSIRKFDASKSGTKRIGKQMKLLETVQKETKTRAIKAFLNNKTKINSSTGRVNENMIIVKIFK
jgi:hypothetical protein